MTSKPSPLPLPGFGLPITWTPAPCHEREREARRSEGETTESMTRGPSLFTNGWHLSFRIHDDDIRLVMLLLLVTLYFTLPWGRMPLITLTEREMLSFMEEITDGAGWELQVGTLNFTRVKVAKCIKDD